MNIAIIAPSHVPFMLGGAERLWTDLCQAINSTGSHQADIIKIPAPESGFWEIIDSYKIFYNLNLDHFDLVISGKNPGWMIRHRNHALYMLHPLRGVYDTYSLFHLPHEVTSESVQIHDIAKACDRGIGTDELFAMLAELRLSKQVDPRQIALPSPFLRKVLHRLDSNAMRGINHFSAISKTVASRSEYFHNNGPVHVLCPPSGLATSPAVADKYFFTYSRLDSAKRIDLLIQAFRKVNTHFEFRIAGTGSELDHLKNLAGNDSRIKFLGRLSDKELSTQLGGAYAVPFVPYQEDYGLVTIEALKTGKPVITTDDSGGPTDFIVDGVNGFIAASQPESLAHAFERALNTDNYDALSSTAIASVADISWDKISSNLIATRTKKKNQGEKKTRVLSLSTYPIYPPKGGGQSRVFYLCEQLSLEFQVHVICLVDGSQERITHKISDSYTIECIPAHADYSTKDWYYYQTSGIPTTDVVMVENFELAKEYIDSIKNEIPESDIIIAEQPYVFPIIEKYGTSKLKVYNSQNLESHLKQQMFQSSPSLKIITDMVYDSELLACAKSDLIVYCSDSDRTNTESCYEPAIRKESLVVENGAATSTISYLLTEERIAIKKRVGAEGPTGVFLASWHQPNIEAVRDLAKIAKETPEINYLVIGSVADYFKQSEEEFPKNIIFTGLVSTEEKDLLLQISDFGINPMSSGSGTNIKMFDYMAAGLPIVSTPTGARGLTLAENIAWVGELSEFPEIIRNVAMKPRSIHRRIFVKENYDWEAVGARYREKVARIVENSKSN